MTESAQPLPEPTEAQLMALGMGADELLRESAGEIPPTQREPGIIGTGAMGLIQNWADRQNINLPSKPPDSSLN